ncbi:kinase-like domain-containing protein [Gigaspora rosea]|uniref:Kinase-like domain-containing protein n=1 Tax=Gigaspora rosea TaxID=44941 RepID=A0A397V3J2_9GLOM|nr:kinase-like domain-containing protein [Gigaspora rosea]
MIEWISFDRLVNIKKIGEGGFGSIFSATWLDGIREIKEIEKTDKDEDDDVDVEDDEDDDDSDFNDDNKDDDNYIYVRTRKPSSTVALKTLSGSKENHDFLKEFESLAKCGLMGTKLKIYGLAQNTKTTEYLMVFQYADNRSLYKFLRESFRELTWQTKLKLLCDISKDLDNIHDAGYIHADFHSGNILQDKGISNVIQSYISDMDSENEISGIIKSQFLAADEIVKELQITLPKHPDTMYTSKIIYTQKISNAIKTALASKPIDSTTITFEYFRPAIMGFDNIYIVNKICENILFSNFFKNRTI